MTEQKKEVKKLLVKIRGEPEDVGAWRCHHCDAWYEDEDEARDCCAMANRSEGWECPDCKAVHEDKEDAENCCMEDNGK